MQAQGAIRVLLADDQVAMRMGVRRALEAGGIEVVAEVDSAFAAVEVAIQHRPDVCLLAGRFPQGWISAAERILDALPAVKIVVLTSSDRDEDLFAALRAGADGYLLKSTSAERLPHAIRGVLQGEAALPRELTARLIREFRDRSRRRRLRLPASGRSNELTVREFEVLDRLRQDNATAEIAAQLQISEVTVRRHISSILHKVGAPDRRTALELIRAAEDGEIAAVATA